MRRAAFALPEPNEATPAVLRTAALWWAGGRAGDGAAFTAASAQHPRPDSTQPTGFAALDAVLPGGGWPRQGLIELLAAENAAGSLGQGALPLLAPAWAGAQAHQVWVAPPAWPYAPALAAQGWQVSRLVVIAAELQTRLRAPLGGPDAKHQVGEHRQLSVRAEPVEALGEGASTGSAQTVWGAKNRHLASHKNDAPDLAWAVEQALRSRACSLVLWWCSERVAPAVLRRLHLAALDHGCLLVALRPKAAQQQSSPAPLRLALQAMHGGMAVDVFKRRGPQLAQPLHLPWPAAWAALAHTPHRTPAPKPSADALVRSAPAAVAA